MKSINVRLSASGLWRRTSVYVPIDGPGQLMTRTACTINYFFVFCSHSALSADSAFVSCCSTVKIVISTLLNANNVEQSLSELSEVECRYILSLADTYPLVIPFTLST